MRILIDNQFKKWGKKERELIGIYKIINIKQTKSFNDYNKTK